MSMFNHVIKALATASCLAMVGCASTFNTGETSDFACDRNRNCPTPLEVYEDTHASAPSVQRGRTPSTWKGGKEKGGKTGGQELRSDLLALSSESALVVAGEPAARPLREAPQVMRIWISPWVDAQDNLNWSGYVFTEITPKRWSFGEQEVRHQGMAPSFVPR